MQESTWLMLLWLYLCLSAAAFVLYALDKTAARRRKRRIPERTLHLLALSGGWPGAWLAQQLLRHKTQKSSFRLLFWGTVLVNCGILLGLRMLPA